MYELTIRIGEEKALYNKVSERPSNALIDTIFNSVKEAYDETAAHVIYFYVHSGDGLLLCGTLEWGFEWKIKDYR